MCAAPSGLRIERERTEVLCFDGGNGQVISGKDKAICLIFQNNFERKR